MSNNNYTIEELREILFQKIDRLIEIEPSWSKCMRCQHKGKCCIKADISIREDEWKIIKEYIQNFNESDKSVLRHNIKHHIFCPFRASDKCLIHEVRSLNCIWTPFQVVQNIQTNDLTFYIPYLSCKYFRKTIKKYPKINDEFVKLRIGNKECYYLFLNDIYIEYINNPEQHVNNLSNLITQIPPLIY